ncbi:MAG: aminoacyl-tRNA hydrolase [Eubacterium sp.]|nr:aminoacyl-tRNA hydrolase [Eubacterium sp.]MBR2279273.1 aminoacyl-tRNA hydrolase [Eubacterium sp.]
MPLKDILRGIKMFFRRGKIQYIIAGLGNPGKKYEKTRHNAGFMAIDLLAKKHGFTFKKAKFQSLIADETICGTRCLFMKPQTMMNLSGEAIADAANYYNIPDENIIVLFDDVSLDVGKIRCRRKGSAGGHNGIKSIISCLGSEEFPRVKIGVGKKPKADYDMVKWVLGEFPSDKQGDLNSALEDAVGAVETMLTDGIDSAMNKFNS